MGLLLNRARALTTTVGTGAAVLSTAAASYRSWSAAGAVSGYSYSYLIEDGAAWELGVGVYNGTTLTRPGPSADPQFLSSTGALLSLSGSAIISSVENQNDIMAGGPFMPPLAASMSLVSGDATNLTLTDDAAGGLLVDAGAAAAGPLQRFAYRTLTTPSGDWTMIAKMRGHIRSENYRGYGLYAMDSAGGKLIGIQTNFSAESQTLRVEHFPGLTGNNLDVALSTLRTNFEWVKIVKSGANITYSTSSDGRLWNDWATESATAYLAAVPNRVGFGAWVFGTTYTTRFSIPYFSLTGSAV